MKSLDQSPLEEKEFRKNLDNLLKNNSPLEEIQTLFKQVPENFDINQRNNDQEAVLMQSLIYGVNLETFKFLEEQGAEITKSINPMNIGIDGQHMPFNIDDNKLVFSSQKTETFDQNVQLGREQNQRSSKNDNQISEQTLNQQLVERWDNSKEILGHIDNKLNVDEKNNINLLQLSTFYMDEKVFDKLLENPNIDRNKIGARNSAPLNTSLFNNQRANFANKLFKDNKVVAKQDDLTLAFQYCGPEEVKEVLNKIPKNLIPEAVSTTLLKIEILENVNKESLQKLVDISPDEVRRFLYSDYQEENKLARSTANKQLLEINKNYLPQNHKSVSEVLKDIYDNKQKKIEIEQKQANKTVEKLEPLIMDLGKKADKGKYITEDEVRKFYTNIGNTLSKSNIIYQGSWDNFFSKKGVGGYEDQVHKTTQMLNMPKETLKGSDKLKYNVSKILKMIKLNKLAKKLEDSMSPESFKKTLQLENVLTKTLELVKPHLHTAGEQSRLNHTTQRANTKFHKRSNSRKDKII